MFRLFFPDYNRSFPGKRWLKISLRTLHLLGIAGIGAGYLFGLPNDQWHSYLLMTLISGYGIVALELWTNGIWLLQVRGLAILFKLLLIWSIEFQLGPAIPLFWLAIIISGIISHATGDLRYFSVYHRKRIEFL